MNRFLPSAPLSSCIECYCFYDGGTLAPAGQERCLPNAQAAIIINLGHDTMRVGDRQRSGAWQAFHGGVLHGAFSQFSCIDTSTMVSTISVCFKPGGMRAFLPLPAGELANQVVELSMLWGSDTADLREQLLSATNRAAMVEILERFLLARASWEQVPPAAVMFALDAFQSRRKQRSITEITDQLGLRPRRFISLFEDSVGLTPKVYCRVRRFQHALHLTENASHVRWTELVLDCGYFDQSHFIHDFQAFAGLTPQAYLTQRGPHRNHIPLPE
ncbi:hypothetical protein KDH_77570 [Dictyobacter sp. S3.2.2.5]|uniref:HTH araC/xylS-type domain-containing protein n=1 Tax=Dictyobacter halimunensis TaxID=3026934 RepID=A0ABQ6G330_9CHLR|nr:hypothetical protein KDH_77570 [Dictyobacter sp. S3.2.2.5]